MLSNRYDGNGRKELSESILIEKEFEGFLVFSEENLFYEARMGNDLVSVQIKYFIDTTKLIG